MKYINNKTFSAFIYVLLFIFLSSFSNTQKNILREYKIRVLNSVEPPLYLPKAEYVKLVTLGFNNFSSHLIWFNTQNYFGKHFRGDKDYRWLKNMCDLVTTLNPKAKHTYNFCASMLSWATNEPIESNKILSRAIKNFPNDWYYIYLRGFNYFYFLKNKELAKKDLLKASSLGNAPRAFLISLVSRLMISKKDIGTTIIFLKNAIKISKDKNARKILTKRLNQAYLTRNLDYLNKAAKIFKSKFNRFPKDVKELVNKKIIQSIPKEPFGGKYLFHTKLKEIISTSKEKKLDFTINNKNLKN